MSKINSVFREKKLNVVKYIIKKNYLKNRGFRYNEVHNQLL